MCRSSPPKSCIVGNRNRTQDLPVMQRARPPRHRSYRGKVEFLSFGDLQKGFLVHWPHQKEPSGSVQENLTKEGKWLNVQTTSFPSSVQVVKCKDERWLSVDFRSDFARMTVTFCSFTAPFKMPNGKSADSLFPLCGNCFLMPKFFQWPMTSTFAALRQSLLKQMRVTEEEIYCKESRTSFGSVNFSH